MDLFDLFFNSANGYRAQYFRSSNRGERKNRLFIETLTPVFLESGTLASVSRQRIEQSLSTASAKTWLAEVEKHLCDKCIGEWRHPQDNTAEILNDRWEHVRDYRGRKAPYLTKIRVFGAFLDEKEMEYVPPGKVRRAEDIRDTGWS